MQTPAPTAQDTSRIESAVVEARELAASDITAAQERLRQLLAELRGWRESGTMQADGGRLYQEALLLHIGIQTKLLAPEEEILGSFRELLLVNPAIDPAAFNPRERLLLERSRIGQTGHLSLKTDLPDVAISYLGSELGRTPLDLPLLAGKYRLVLSRPTYLDQAFDAEIRAGEILVMERTMRRSTVSVPLSVPVPGIRLKLNGREVGLTLGFEPWLASLPGDVRERLGEIVQGWRVDTRTGGFFRLTEVPVGEPLQLDLEGPCYEPLNIQWTVSEQEVDWTRSFVVAPELRAIAMTREVGFLEVASAPEGAEVWLDGRLEGRTPMGMDVCAGTHRVQVLHPAGQFTREVVLRKGQVSKVSGELKPALAFLGIYTGVLPPVEGGICWTPSRRSWPGSWR
ncbi:MAG: PEGA domain-containing protein [Acidobacteriota bacterium]